MDQEAPGKVLLRKYKPLIILSCVLIAFIAIVTFFVFNSFVFITINGTKGSVSTIAVSNNESKNIGGGGLLVVPRSTVGLLIKSGDNIKTQTAIDLPWYGFATKSVDLKADRDAEKVAYLGFLPVCATYNSEDDQLLQYGCQSPVELARYETPDDGNWTNKTVTDLQYLDGQVLSPYLGGVLGFAIGSDGQANDTDDSGHSEDELFLTVTTPKTKQSYPAPSGLSSDSLAGLRVFTDTRNTENSHFAVADAFGAIYLGKLSDDRKTASYKRISPPNDYNYRLNQTFCSLNADILTCFRSRSEAEADKNATKTAPSIIELNFNQDEQQLDKVEGLSVIDGLYVTDSGKTYATAGKNLYTLNHGNDKYTAHKLFQSVDSVSSGKKLYFIQANGVHELDDATLESHQVFYSPYITLKVTYPVGDKLFIFGSTKNDTSSIHAYSLSAAANTAGDRRVIDVAPFTANKVTGVSQSNLVGDKITVLRSSNEVSVEDARNNVVDTLLDLGINFDKGNVEVIQ